MTKINWISLETVEQLDSLIKNSHKHPVLIYNPSTRCGISSLVHSRLERAWDELPVKIDCYFLDLIAYRDISDQVEQIFQVRHESPQTLLIIDGRCKYHASHMGISFGSIRKALDDTGTLTFVR